MNEGNPISDLLRITSRLTGLLDREVEMLRAMKPSEIEALRQDKSALSAAYQSQIKVLKANPAILGSISAELRADLKAKIKKFQAALSANQYRLRAAREATECALRAIADEVQAKTDKHTGYSAQGATSAPSPSGRTSALAFAFDQRL